MSYESEQDEWIVANGISVGSIVTVLRQCNRDERGGWPVGWVPDMNTWVGRTCNVIEISSRDGILLRKVATAIDTDGSQYWFPWFVLLPEGKEIDILERAYRIHPQTACRGMTNTEAAILLSIKPETLSFIQVEQILALFDEKGD